MVLMDMLPVAELVFPPTHSLKEHIKMTFLQNSVFKQTGPRESCPHPLQTVRAAEEVFDQLVICQARDVSGADGDLSLPPNHDGLVGGGEGLLSDGCCLVLRRVRVVNRDNFGCKTTLWMPYPSGSGAKRGFELLLLLFVQLNEPLRP